MLPISGLMLDIIGACLLARGILRSDQHNIVDEGFVNSACGVLEFYGAKRIRSRLVDRRWTRYGLMLMIAGFAIQGFAQLPQANNQQPILLILVIIGGLVMFLIDLLSHHRDSVSCSAELANRIYNNNPPSMGITGLSPHEIPRFALLIRYGESVLTKPVNSQMRRYWAAVHHQWGLLHN